MLRAVRFAAVLVLAMLAGCGGSGSSSSGAGKDPASAVPANAPLYFDASLRPEGDVKENALDAAGKILRTSDPQAKIDELVNKAFADSEDPKLDYARDVKPWLGEKSGFWLATTSQNDEGRGAAVLSSTDSDKAQEAIDRAIKGSEKTFTRSEYKGHDLDLNGDGSAVAVLDDFVIAGTEAEVERSIAALDGDSLADSDRYKKAIAGLDEDRLGSFYVDVKAVFDEAVKQDSQVGQQLQQLRGVMAFDPIGPVTGSFSADGDELAVDALTSGSSDLFKSLGGGGSTPLLGELPGDSWGAYGVPKLGQTAKTLYGKVAGALGGAAIQQQLRQQLGIDLEQDVFSWIGDVAIFVRGTGMADIDGGAVIQITDKAKAASAFGKLVGLLRTQGDVDARPVKIDGAEAAFAVREPGAPKPIVIARGSDKAVIAYGEAAAVEALAPKSKLADSDAYNEAKSLLGDSIEPLFLLSVPAVVDLAGSTAGSDPDFQMAKPYLDGFGTAAAGGKVEDGRARSRAAVGLK